MFEFLKTNKNKSIHVNAIDDLIGKIELIDIRESYEYKSGSIKTAKNIPMRSLLETPEKYLIKEKAYHLMCQTGSRSKRTTKILAKKGYTVVNIAGGVGSYTGKKKKTIS